MTNYNVIEFGDQISIEHDRYIYVRTVDHEAAVRFFKSLGIRDPKVIYDGISKRGGLAVYKCPTQEDIC